MDRKSKFFICRHCNNLVNTYYFSGNIMSCCGEKMENIEPKTENEGREKHLPRVSVQSGRVKVNVGEVSHPMTEEHNIGWVYLVTKAGEQRKTLIPGATPELTFVLENDDLPIAAYAYCNLHGLWKTQINKGK